MMEPLHPLYGFGGGAMIGVAASLFLLLSGRIAGVSGLFASATGLSEGGPTTRAALMFVLALPLGAWFAAHGVRMPDIAVTSSIPLLLAGGLLVGFGARLGNGCTSGHGVCGVARLSPRSLAATAVFMAAGFATVFAIRHLPGAG